MRSSVRRDGSFQNFYTESQVRNVLQEIGIRISNETSDDFLVLCPYHNNTHTPACEVNKTKGLFVCFSCGASGRLHEMVMHVDERGLVEAHRLIAKYKSDYDILELVENSLEPEPEQDFDETIIDKLHAGLLESDRGQKYWRTRGISKSTAVDFKLGYSAKRDMVITPVQDHLGKYVGFIGRSVQGKQFRNSDGMRKTSYVFNLHRVSGRQVVVVESSIDAMLLSQQGIDAVAIMGNSPSKRQIELLRRMSSGIIVVPDNDKAGAKMVHVVMEKIPEKFMGVNRIPGGKDIGDLSRSQLKTFAESIGNNQLI